MLLLQVLSAIIIFFLGASVFSFLNVVIYRVPRRISFVKGFSMCPVCQHRLYGQDMVPLLSWLVLKGRCRYCGAKVSARYSLVELLGGLAALLCAIKYSSLFTQLQQYLMLSGTAGQELSAGQGFSIAFLQQQSMAPVLQAVTVFAFLSVLNVVAFVDLDTMEIPNGFVIAAAIVGAGSCLVFAQPGLIERIIGVLAVSLPLLLITLLIPGAFGGGDIKLMAACGLFLGWKLSIISAFIAIISGGIYGAYLLLSGKKGRKEHFAFGPFLCLGMTAAVFYGQNLLNWYLGLCGLL